MVLEEAHPPRPVRVSVRAKSALALIILTKSIELSDISHLMSLKMLPKDSRLQQDQTVVFTGADLKRTVEDGKALYAYDRVAGKTPREVTEYYVDAAKNVSESKEKYAMAEERANACRTERPVWFNPYSQAELYEE